MGLDNSMKQPAKALVDACHQLAPHRGGMDKPMRVLICGIPNVGKSTLINTLKGKAAAKTGDIAGVTKTEQRVHIADDFYLYDTPGVLWPRIIVLQSGYNLAASGAIGVNAFDDEEVALELLSYLMAHYPEAIQARYKLADLSGMTDEALLEAIGRQRGALQGGGRVNTTKAAELVIHDLRSGALGRITLETPEEFARWLAEGKKADAERAARKEAFARAKAQQTSQRGRTRR
jgi:ribosome biogenesis GTPase A